MEIHVFKVGDRVFVNDIKQVGTVFHIDHKNLYNDWTMPIQVELDRPHDEPHLQRMYCCSLKELRWCGDNEKSFHEQEANWKQHSQELG